MYVIPIMLAVHLFIDGYLNTQLWQRDNTNKLLNQRVIH